MRAITVFAVLMAVSSTLPGAQLPVRLYTTDDGLASNSINRIVQDSRGFLWFCTREGISRFDGYRFTNFGRDQGLPGHDEDLLETRSGEYWVATGEGVALFNQTGRGPQFTLYRPADPKARRIIALLEDGTGGIWCGTEGGLYRLGRTGEGWVMRFVDIGMPTKEFDDTVIEALLLDRGRGLWIGGPSGLYLRSGDGRCQHYLLRKVPGRTHITALLEDRVGRLWVGVWEEGLFRISIKPESSEPSMKKLYTKKEGLAGVPVLSLLQTSDGQLWVGGSGGLSRYISDGERDEFERFTDVNGLTENEVRTLGEDRAGNLWVGSTGVSKISRGGFVTYGKPDGLPSRSVQSVFDDKEGELCAVTERNSVSCFDGRRFHSVSPNIPSYVKYWGWGSGQITFQDHTGKWWVPTGQGLFRFPKTATFAQLGRVRPEAVFDARNGLPGDVFRLFEDTRGDVWIATQVAGGNGLLMRWERATGILRNVPTNLLAHAFAEDRAGNVWIGFNGALARYCHSRLQFFEAPKAINHYEIRALYVDREGHFWVACRDGVVRVDPWEETPQFTTYTTANGLSSNEAQCVTEDLWGRIYVGTGRGVDCFSSRMPLYIRHYTKADGIALGNSMVAFHDHKGALWFGTPLGLSRLEPKPERPRTPPPILISALRVRGVPRRISPLGETAISALKLGPNQTQIEMEFVGLGFGTGEVLRYQYRLEGADTAWSQPTDERRIDYASLSPGSYRFLVRAITTDGLVSATPASVEFAIAAPVWQRWWMRMLLMIVSGAILYSLYRYRVSRLLEMERLRTRIATDLHDDVGSTLSQIAILSEVASRGARTEEQLESLSEIADLSRESVDSMSDIVWAIDPEQDRLGDLSRRMRRFASDLLASSGIQVEFHAPGEAQDPEIGADIRRQIFLIFKESLHNTARHSGCTAVEIDFKLEKGWLALTVRDNGKGFDVAQRNAGHGLASIEKRAKELRGQVRVNSAPGCGTTIRLEAPLG